MDPVSQGILGASFSQSAVQNKKLLGLVGFIGFMAGMAPDLDILIRSQEDYFFFFPKYANPFPLKKYGYFQQLAMALMGF
jgi:hypothetical protein